LKQLLLGRARREIAEKYLASRFIVPRVVVASGHPGVEGVTDMISAVETNSAEVRELTIDELDEAGGGLLGLMFALAFGIGYAAAAWYYSQRL